MLTGRTKPIRITGDPDNLYLDNWSSTVCYSLVQICSVLEAEWTPTPLCGLNDYIQKKIPVTPTGIETATLRLVAQCFQLHVPHEISRRTLKIRTATTTLLLTNKATFYLYKAICTHCAISIKSAYNISSSGSLSEMYGQMVFLRHILLCCLKKPFCYRH